MSGTTTPTVLVVEDDETVADTYRAFLHEEYDVRTASDGREGLERIDEDVDVVLLDRLMPGLSGDDLLDRIREREHDVRVVMLTAVAPEFAVVEMPFDDYVVKPVDREGLLETVEDMLERASFGDDRRRFLALASKRSTLEAERTHAELQNDERYRAVTERMTALHDRLGIDGAEPEPVFDRERLDRS